MSKWDNNNDWFFDNFDKNIDKAMKRGIGMVLLVWLLNILGIIAIIAAVVVGLVILL